MTHNLGRVVADGRTIDQSNALDLVPGPGPLGGPRFVILHFDQVNLTGSARLTVQLGYGVDTFTAGSGSDLWSRPIDPSLGPIAIRVTGGSGSARLREYGSGEPSIPPGHTPGTPEGSRTNPDPFLQTNPYEEPIYAQPGIPQLSQAHVDWCAATFPTYQPQSDSYLASNGVYYRCVAPY